MNWFELLSPHRFGQKSRAPGKGNELRSAFEQDFDRILFSHPFRRLQDKTQVFPLPEHDFVHTRLTHSLEVSSVGKSLGRKAGEIILGRHPELSGHALSRFDFGAIAAAASLAHDLGNPPFGHSGEDAISDFFRNNPQASQFRAKVDEKQWADLCNFEGNAQGFRILNKGSYQGLSLTMATLATFTKYPRESLIQKPDKYRKSHKKYGFFQAEKHLFEQLANEVGLVRDSQEDLVWCRHPMAFLVEAADDICYSIIDLEDGCRLGLVTYEETKELLACILGTKFDEAKLNRIDNVNERISLLRAISIGILIDQCIEIFEANETTMLSGSFDQALTDLIPARKTLEEISRLSIRCIYRARVVMETEAAGFEVINGLLERFLPASFRFQFEPSQCTSRDKSIVRLLPKEIFQLPPDQNNQEYNLIMNMIDFVSGMTDSFAISLYRKIKGITLPSGFPTNF